MSPVFNAALDVPGISEMILQWALYFCQNNVNIIFQVSVHIDRCNEDWGFVSVILKISKFYCVKLILKNMTVINAKERTEVGFFLEE